MRHAVMLGFVMVFGAVGCGVSHSSGPSVEGSGTQKTEPRDVSGFTKVAAGGAMQITIACGKAGKCEVTADDNVLPLIKTTVDGDTLKVTTEGSVSTRSGMKLALEVADLKEVELSGATTLALTGVKNDALALTISGTGNATVSGETGAVTINLTGAGKVNAADLKAKTAKVDCAGAGAIEVFASDQLDAKVSGVGHVSYAGNPKTVNKQVSGVGSISPK